MADIAPLRPLRYADPTRLAQLVAPPYDVVDAEHRARLAARDEHNVVAIDLPEGDGDSKYERARELFSSWQDEGVLVRDETLAYWRYAQTFTPPGGGEPVVRRGFFAAVRAVPFGERVVLPHERTLKGPKLDRMNLSRATRATLSPQFMLYSDPRRELDAALDSGKPFADFEYDGVRQELWRVSDPESVARITSTLADGKLYIADGHHRYETAVALAREIDGAARRSGATPSSRGEHLFTFALLANGDDPDLVVFPTHRLVHSLGAFDAENLFARAAEIFDVREVRGGAGHLVAELVSAGEERAALCAVTGDGGARLLMLKSGVDLSAHPVLGKRPGVLRDAGVALLHYGVLEHILGITPEAQAAKTNIKYMQDAADGIARVERGEGQVLFLMNATPVQTIRRVSDAGEVMPQKSTFFYPKVLTGLLFHTLETGRVVG